MRILIFTLLIVFSSCYSKQQHDKYNTLITQVDRIVVMNKQDGKTFELSSQGIQNFKEIATRNVKIESVKKFQSDFQIDLYKGTNRVAYYMIKYGNDAGFGNFHSHDFSIGFKLTYGIGRFLDELEYHYS